MKKLIYLLFFLAAVFIGYKYFLFKKNETYYKNNKVKLEYMQGTIDHYLRNTVNEKSELPSKKNIIKKLQEWDKYFDTSFFIESNFSLVIDSTDNHVIIYSFGISRKDNNLSNALNSFSLTQKDDYNFIDFLFKGDYDLIFINDYYEGGNVSESDF